MPIQRIIILTISLSFIAGSALIHAASPLFDPCNPLGSMQKPAADFQLQPPASRFGKPSRDLTLLTYNVAGFYQGFPEGSVLSKMGWGGIVKAGDNAKWISKLLKQYDVVLLQENWSYYDVMAKGLPGTKTAPGCVKPGKKHQYLSTPPFHPADLGVAGVADWNDLQDPALLDKALSAALAKAAVQTAEDGINCFDTIGHGLAIHSNVKPQGFDAALESANNNGYNFNPGFEPWKVCAGNDLYTRKGFIFDRIQVTEKGGTVGNICIYNYHTDANDKPETVSLDVQARHDQHCQLLAHINANCPDDAVILAGDTNLRPWDTADDQKAYDMILAGGPAAQCQGFVATETTSYKAFTDVAPPGTQEIDHFFYRNGKALQLAVKSYTSVVGFTNPQSGEALSDHPPIAVTFTASKL